MAYGMLTCQKAAQCTLMVGTGTCKSTFHRGASLPFYSAIKEISKTTTFNELFCPYCQSSILNNQIHIVHQYFTSTGANLYVGFKVPVYE